MQPRGCKVSEGREIPGSLWRSPEPAPSAMHGLLRGSQLGFVPVLPALEILRLLGAVGIPERVDAEGRESRKERRGERTGLTCATAFTRLPLLLAACSTENGQRRPKRGSEALSSWTATHFPAGVWITPQLGPRATGLALVLARLPSLGVTLLSWAGGAQPWAELASASTPTPSPPSSVPAHGSWCHLPATCPCTAGAASPCPSAAPHTE